MAHRSFYTTFEISQICGVNPTTVQNWVKGKKLRAFQTPGGHRRVSREDLLSFMKEFEIPIPAELIQDPPSVMLVDDETEVLDMLESVLRAGDEGIKVVRAQSGVEALLLIGENKPSLLILDVLMPGMNGLEVCRRLKSNPSTRNIKIIAITGDHDPLMKEHVLRAGVDLFFTKPIDVTEFRKQCIGLLQF